MAREMHIPKVSLAYSWPSMASASAELCRPRRSRVGQVENSAVLSLVPPAAADVEPVGSSVPEATSETVSTGRDLR
jgi:hypothetical protein